MSDSGMTHQPARGATSDRPDIPRRSFLAHVTGLTMAGGLVASYGTLTVFAGRFLYPANPRRMAWLFAAQVSELRVGDAFEYTAPTGETIVIARQHAADDASSFIALSSTCPHLGCQVHWESANDRFFCPCHNGVFDPSGKAIEGPPAQAGTDLSRYELRIENGLLYIHVPTERLGDGPAHQQRVALTVDRRCLDAHAHSNLRSTLHNETERA